MAEWAVWLEEVLEVVAMPVGSDIVGNIRSDPLNIRELRVVKTCSAAVVTSGYFTGSGGMMECSALLAFPDDRKPNQSLVTQPDP